MNIVDLGVDANAAGAYSGQSRSKMFASAASWQYLLTTTLASASGFSATSLSTTSRAWSSSR